MWLLAGDVGGTTTRLRLASLQHGLIAESITEQYPSQHYPDLFTLLTEFLTAHPCASLTAACFAVAGPITAQSATVTNLPWHFTAAELAAHFQIENVTLLNDFQGVGYGIETLQAAELLILQQGNTQLHGVRAVLGAGTGLGMGMMVWQAGEYVMLPSEGGHADFAPTTDEQWIVWQELKQQRGRVSVEDILSGCGLESIYRILYQRVHAHACNQTRCKAELISQRAMRGEDPVAVQALNLFVTVYGAQAGNLALMMMATGGVYISGGIASKISAWLQNGVFMQAFHNKAPMQTLMQGFAVQVILDPLIGLRGAMRYAQRRVAS
jgi:glucokinase